MARKRPPDQIDNLLDAAETVYAGYGHGAAHVSAVAEEAGVGLGTLYHYFTGKEALLRWAIMRRLHPGAPLPDALPIDSPSGTLDEQLLPFTNIADRFPLLHLTDRERDVSADPRAKVVAAVSELYLGIEQGRQIVGLVEAATIDDDRWATFWFDDFVERLVDAWASFVVGVRDAAGLDAVEHPELVGRFVITTVTYFARIRHTERSSRPYPDDATVQAAVTDMIVGAVLAESSPR